MFLLTAASSGMYANTGPITTVHLTLITVLIVLVVFAVLWGMRQKRARDAADVQEKATAEAMAAHPVATAAVSPAPPPLGDSGMGMAQADAAPVAATPGPADTSAEPVARAPNATGTTATYGLNHVKGLGPKAVPLLAAESVTDLSALAELTPARAAEIDAALGALSGRMARDRWVDQARLLVAGDVAGFEQTYGKL